MHDIRDRSDLIALVAKRAPVVSCRRACLTDRVENLGAFSSVYGHSTPYPGWIVRVKSGRKMHLIGVVPGAKDYFVWALESVPLENWVGDQGTQPLYQGDHPGGMKKLRENAEAINAAKADNVRCDVGLA